MIRLRLPLFVGGLLITGLAFAGRAPVLPETEDGEQQLYRLVDARHGRFVCAAGRLQLD